MLADPHEARGDGRAEPGALECLRQALAVQSDHAEGGAVVLPTGVHHEPVVERGILAPRAPEGGPQLLLAERDRMVRDHGGSE